jgi:large subunit ribosomal protein L37Ae
MAKGTKKVGITGRYGPRYGVKIRKQIKEASRHRARAQRCPECQADAVKRVSAGIWLCNHCKLKFAAAAYSVRTRSYKREVTRSNVGEYIITDTEGEEQPEGEETVEPEPEVFKAAVVEGLEEPKPAPKAPAVRPVRKVQVKKPEETESEQVSKEPVVESPEEEAE